MADNTWEWFIKRFEHLSEIDLNAYKRPQMERRINSFMNSNGSKNYADFVPRIESDKELYHKFLEHITINVSEFFRNTNHWEVLENKVIPMLLSKRKSIKVWSAGCSTGEEPYSLAMLFKNNNINLADKILATDIDKDILAKAGMGLYNAKNTKGIPLAYGKKYTVIEGDFLKINNEIKSMVKFQRHNLLKDSFPKGYDLILCRNVVIYFTGETKDKLYRDFAGALNKEGVLFVGNTEQVLQAKDIGLKTIFAFFYEKE